MFYLLFSILFVVMALCAVLSGMRKGKNFVWSYSMVGLAAVIVAAVAAAFLSAKVSFLLFNLLFSIIKGGTGDFATLLTSLPVMVEALSAIASMFVAPLLFFVLFAVLRRLLEWGAKSVLRVLFKNKGTETPSYTAESGKKGKTKKLSARKKKRQQAEACFRVYGKTNVLGRLCGALCGLFMFLAMMIPTVGMLGILGDMTAWGLADSTNPVMQSMVEFVDAAANNKGAQSVRVLGGDALYSMMTTYEVDGEKASLENETNLLGTIGHAISDMTNKEVSRKDAAETVREIDDAFSETALIPSVLPDFMNAAKDSWDRGEEYCGIEKPASEKNGGLIVPILNVFGNSSKETIHEDIATLVDSMAYMVEKDALTDVIDDPMSMFEKQDVTAKVMCDLLKNDHLAPLVGDISEYGIALFGESMGATMTDIDLDSSDIKNPETEAMMLAATLAEMAEMTKTIDRIGLNNPETIVALGPVLDSFAWTETVGRENTDKMLVNILTSPTMMSATHLDYEQSKETADLMVAGAKMSSYTVQLEGLVAKIQAGAEFKFGN